MQDRDEQRPAQAGRQEPRGSADARSSARDDAAPDDAAPDDAAPDTGGVPKADAPGAAPRRVWLRLGLLVGVLGAGYAVAQASGLASLLKSGALRHTLRSAGVWSIPLFLVAFTVGELLYVPGLVFVGVAVYVYGRSLGAVVALGGALCSVTIAFLLVRAIGGRALHAFRRPLLRRALGSLEARPIFTMFWLRSVFFMAPVLNYALALSGVGFRDYVLASGLGLVVPILGSAWALDWLLAQELSALRVPAGAIGGGLLVAGTAVWAWRRRGRRASDARGAVQESLQPVRTLRGLVRGRGEAASQQATIEDPSP